MTFLVFSATERGPVPPPDEDVASPKPIVGNGYRTGSVIAHPSDSRQVWAIADGAEEHVCGEAAKALKHSRSTCPTGRQLTPVGITPERLLKINGIVRHATDQGRT